MNQLATIDQKKNDELSEREDRIERAQRNAYLEIGLELAAIRDGELYKIDRDKPVAGQYSFTTFEEYVESRWDMKWRRAYQLIDAAKSVSKICTIVQILPSRESHVRELLTLESDDDRATVWQRVVSRNETITAKAVAEEVQRFVAEKQKDWITLDEWKQSEGKPTSWHSDKTLNKQDNNSIEWAQWTWNPVTGCKHDCPYCYARDIANRFYPQGFEPAIYPGRMAAPANTRLPAKAEEDTAFRNVFTCSMADLFGRWVPDEWINAVFDRVRENPQWNFLFLTKFAHRMVAFDYPENAWLGTSVDCQARVKAAEKAFAKVRSGTRWLSIEPMLEPIRFERLDLFDWVVIGGASKSTKTPEWVPPLDWIVDIHRQAREAGCRIYYKDNTKLPDELRIKEFPWDAPRQERALPDSLKYLGMNKDD